MKKEKNWKIYARGSYTVEASLVFPILLLVFISMLYMIFYIHDRYILYVYANRMAQECCWLMVENEHELEKRSHEQIIDQVSKKFGPELEKQLILVTLTESLGTCKRNILTHLYTSTWKVVGETVMPMNLSSFRLFPDIVIEVDETRVSIRKWIYTKEIEKRIGE